MRFVQVVQRGRRELPLGYRSGGSVGSREADGVAGGQVGVDQHHRARVAVLEAEGVERRHIAECRNGVAAVNRSGEVIRCVVVDGAGIHGPDDRLVDQRHTQKCRTHIVGRPAHVHYRAPQLGLVAVARALELVLRQGEQRLGKDSVVLQVQERLQGHDHSLAGSGIDDVQMRLVDAAHQRVLAPFVDVHAAGRRS